MQCTRFTRVDNSQKGRDIPVSGRSATVPANALGKRACKLTGDVARPCCLKTLVEAPGPVPWQIPPLLLRKEPSHGSSPSLAPAISVYCLPQDPAPACCPVFSRVLRFEPLEDRRVLDAALLLEDLLPDRFEPNEELADAAVIGVAPGVHLAQLSIHEPSDVDWYSFRILRSDAVDVKIAFDAETAELALGVFDAVGALLLEGSPSSEGLVAALECALAGPILRPRGGSRWLDGAVRSVDCSGSGQPNSRLLRQRCSDRRHVLHLGARR
jgi:hypothetical protein